MPTENQPPNNPLFNEGQPSRTQPSPQQARPSQQPQPAPINMNADPMSDEQGPTQDVQILTEQEQKEADAALSVPVQTLQAILADQEWKRFELDVRMAKSFGFSGYFGLRGSARAPIPQKQAAAMAFVRIQVGRSLGFEPAQAMMGIDIINDKPVIEYHLLSARCKSLGYDWEPHFTYENGPGTRCTGCFLYLKKSPGKGMDPVPMLKTKRTDKGDAVQKKNLDGTPRVDDNGDPVYETEQVMVAFTKEDAQRITQEKIISWKKNQYGNSVPDKKEKVSLWDKDTYNNYGQNMFFARAFHNAQRFYMSEAINGPALLKGALEEEDEIETYPSGPDQYRAYASDLQRQAAGNELRTLQAAQGEVIDVPAANGHKETVPAATSGAAAPARGGFGKR